MTKRGSLGALKAPLHDFRHIDKAAPLARAVELDTDVEAPCEACRSRAAHGMPANPLHPCCASRLRGGGV